jgi:ElaB/YqjD/DUF883 family membrane-anchored ribosome-binding protein
MGERTDPLSHDHESPAEIRRDIAETQREMSQTIDEIQYRLSPAHMKAQARESVRRAGVRTTRGTIDRVRANPLGAAMVGAGLYLLMRNQHDEHDYETHFGSDFDRDRSYAAYGSAGAFDRYSAPGEYRDLDYGNGGGRMADAKDRVSGAMDDVREKLDDVRERTGHAFDEAAERARMMRSRARYRARSASMQGRDMLMDNPLVGGLAAIALGALIGAMLPETERENELLGEASDRITDRISDVARSGADQAKHLASAVASATKEAATDTAKREVKTAKEQLKNEMGV